MKRLVQFNSEIELVEEFDQVAGELALTRTALLNMIMRDTIRRFRDGRFFYGTTAQHDTQNDQNDNQESAR